MVLDRQNAKQEDLNDQDKYMNDYSKTWLYDLADKTSTLSDPITCFEIV